MSHLNIPMNTAELPQQKIYQVKAFPKWPVGCGVMLLGGQVANTLPGLPDPPTNASIRLDQVEWLTRKPTLRVVQLGM